MRKIAIAVLLLSLAWTRASGQKLSGAGATLPAPIYARWFSEFSAAHPGVHISYHAVGSGGGVRQASLGLVDFGASDGPMTDYQLANARIKLVQIPTVLAAVVPIFNIPGVTDLRFSADVLAGVYLGKIQNWSDPRIASDNPGLKLPNLKIAVVHRADGSGTSYIFTDYLSKVSPAWASGPGRSTSPVWPVGEGADSNAALAALVGKTPGSIGYVELTYALKNKVSFGEVRNRDGNWVKADTESVTSAAASLQELPSDYLASITNAPGAGAYPISSFTWLLVPLKSPDADKGKLLKDLLTWIVTTGESEASTLAYAPLPKPVADKVLATVATLQ